MAWGGKGDKLAKKSKSQIDAAEASAETSSDEVSGLALEQEEKPLELDFPDGKKSRKKSSKEKKADDYAGHSKFLKFKKGK